VIEVFWFPLESLLWSGAAHAVPTRPRVAITAPTAKMRLLLTYFLLGVARADRGTSEKRQSGPRLN
jgi:hypothetical protein